jgi:Resolvase, N terminal domain
MENETEGIVLQPVGQGRLAQKPWRFAGGVAFKVIDDPSIDTTSRTGKLIMGILALIAEFENDIRRERQQDGINKAKLKE